MKLIEAMKEIKLIHQKCSDIRERIQECCADYSTDDPKYGTEDEQRDKVAGWLQSHTDLCRNMVDLKRRITKTNLETPVTIHLGEEDVTLCIKDWITRRTEVAQLESSAFRILNDKGLNPNLGVPSTYKDQDSKPIKIRRYYDPNARDVILDALREEHTKGGRIDQALEVVNATTELVEG